MERREVALELGGIEEAGFELAEDLEEPVGEASEAGGGREAVELGGREHAAHEQGALRLRDERPGTVAGEGDPLEDVVERPDGAREERRPAREELALDAVDVRPVGHDEERLALERGQVAVEQKPDFARVCRPSDEAERHRSIVEPSPDDFTEPPGAGPQRADFFVSRARSMHVPCKTWHGYIQPVAADFGLRPRRATARPGIAPEQSSQRSACLAPRRASVYVIRITAPFPSSTSLEHLSHTRTVFLAMAEIVVEIRLKSRRPSEPGECATTGAG